jgi:hypothetical protein
MGKWKRMVHPQKAATRRSGSQNKPVSLLSDVKSWAG